MKPKIIVEVSGGVVQCIYSNDDYIDVEVMDWDNAECDEQEMERCEELAKKAKFLSVVY